MNSDKTRIDQLHEHYDHTDQAAALADATLESATAPVLVSTSIRLPQSLMDAVRTRAAAAGIPATTPHAGLDHRPHPRPGQHRAGRLRCRYRATHRQSRPPHRKLTLNARPAAGAGQIVDHG